MSKSDDFLGKYGSPEIHDKLIKDKSDENWTNRAHVAQYGNDGHRDELINDEHHHVRSMVAVYGNDSIAIN
jgi:hypothetical protein